MSKSLRNFFTSQPRLLAETLALEILQENHKGFAIEQIDNHERFTKRLALHLETSINMREYASLKQEEKKHFQTLLVKSFELYIARKDTKYTPPRSSMKQTAKGLQKLPSRKTTSHDSDIPAYISEEVIQFPDVFYGFGLQLGILNTIKYALENNNYEHLLAKPNEEMLDKMNHTKKIQHQYKLFKKTNNIDHLTRLREIEIEHLNKAVAELLKSTNFWIKTQDQEKVGKIKKLLDQIILQPENKQLLKKISEHGKDLYYYHKEHEEAAEHLGQFIGGTVGMIGFAMAFPVFPMIMAAVLSTFPPVLVIVGSLAFAFAIMGLGYMLFKHLSENAFSTPRHLLSNVRHAASDLEDSAADISKAREATLKKSSKELTELNNSTKKSYSPLFKPATAPLDSGVALISESASRL